MRGDSMTRLDYEAMLDANIQRLRNLSASLKRTPLPEDAFHDVAIIEYGGVTLVCGGDYDPPCDQWPGWFEVCSVRVEDSRTDILNLLTAAQIKTISDRCYWSIRNDVDALMAAAK